MDFLASSQTIPHPYEDLTLIHDARCSARHQVNSLTLCPLTLFSPARTTAVRYALLLIQPLYTTAARNTKRLISAKLRKNRGL